MSKPENGAEKTYFVLGVVCIQIFEWNEHYIKDADIKDVIIFDVSSQKYFNWDEFVDFIHDKVATLDVTPNEQARKNMRQIRYKCFKPIETISRKKILKTKKKIENNYVGTSSR